jgi:hypothetical protein
MANIGIFPAQLKFRSMNFKQETKTKITQTASGRTIRATGSTTRWSVTIQMPVRTIEEHKTLQGFIALTQGPLNDFEIVLTNISQSSGALGSSVSAGASGAHSAGDTSINIITNYGDATVLKSGDVVRFAGHSKVYMVTSDINTDSAGGAVLNIQPALIENVANLESMIVHNVPFKMALNNDVQEYNYRTDGFVEYEMDLIEVFA